MKDFIDLGGGATPRPKEKPDIVLGAGAPRRIISSDKFKMLLRKYDETGRLDREDFNDSKDVCDFIDFYNNTVLKTKQSEYDKMVTDRNEYYWKLWIRAIEDAR